MVCHTVLHWSVVFVVLLVLGGCTGAPAAPVGQQSNDTATPSAAPTVLTNDPATAPGTSPQATVEQRIAMGRYNPLIECSGQGSPTVVLEHGLGSNQYDWEYVQPAVARFTRVCSYTRPPKGQVSQPRTSQQIVDDLHTILNKADIAGPYVLVGHSIGGYNVRLYADQYPDEVVGLVLVDALHEEFRERSLAVLPPEPPTDSQWWQDFHNFLTYVHPDNNPEGVDVIASAEQVRATGSLGDLPLVVLTAGKSDWPSDWPPGFPRVAAAAIEQVTLEMQQELAGLSTNSTHIIAEESGHFIQKDQPELVVDAIRQVVEAAQDR